MAMLTFVQVNRNKKSIALNFKDPEGYKILKSIIETSDIVVENYVPGTMKRHNLDYETLKRECKNGEQLIYASVTGYGQNGPYSSKAGYDIMICVCFTF